jgi:hypothetical protein
MTTIINTEQQAQVPAIITTVAAPATTGTLLDFSFASEPEIIDESQENIARMAARSTVPSPAAPQTSLSTVSTVPPTVTTVQAPTTQAPQQQQVPTTATTGQQVNSYCENISLDAVPNLRRLARQEGLSQSGAQQLNKRGLCAYLSERLNTGLSLDNVRGSTLADYENATPNLIETQIMVLPVLVRFQRYQNTPFGPTAVPNDFIERTYDLVSIKQSLTDTNGQGPLAPEYLVSENIVYANVPLWNKVHDIFNSTLGVNHPLPDANGYDLSDRVYSDEERHDLITDAIIESIENGTFDEYFRSNITAAIGGSFIDGFEQEELPEGLLPQVIENNIENFQIGSLTRTLPEYSHNRIGEALVNRVITVLNSVLNENGLDQAILATPDDASVVPGVDEFIGVYLDRVNDFGAKSRYATIVDGINSRRAILRAEEASALATRPISSVTATRPLSRVSVTPATIAAVSPVITTLNIPVIPETRTLPSTLPSLLPPTSTTALPLERVQTTPPQTTATTTTIPSTVVQTTQPAQSTQTIRITQPIQTTQGIQSVQGTQATQNVVANVITNAIVNAIGQGAFDSFIGNALIRGPVSFSSFANSNFLPGQGRFLPINVDNVLGAENSPARNIGTLLSVLNPNLNRSVQSAFYNRLLNAINFLVPRSSIDTLILSHTVNGMEPLAPTIAAIRNSNTIPEQNIRDTELLLRDRLELLLASQLQRLRVGSV